MPAHSVVNAGAYAHTPRELAYPAGLMTGIGSQDAPHTRRSLAAAHRASHGSRTRSGTPCPQLLTQLRHAGRSFTQGPRPCSRVTCRTHPRRPFGGAPDTRAQKKVPGCGAEEGVSSSGGEQRGARGRRGGLSDAAERHQASEAGVSLRADAHLRHYPQTPSHPDPKQHHPPLWRPSTYLDLAATEVRLRCLGRFPVAAPFTDRCALRRLARSA